MSTILRLSAFLVSVLLALPATAAQRTFVASFGNDANLCSINSPCRSFTRALTQTDANGEVIVLDSAGYGAFTVTQSVSVVAPDGVYAGISVFAGAPDASHGIVVNGASIKVTLRGLTINGQGGDDGVRIVNAGDVFIEKVTIANSGNNINDAGIRIASGAAVAGVSVTDTTVRGTAGVGIRTQADTTLLLERCRIEGNGSDGVVGTAAGGRLTVTDSLVANNQSVGVWVIASAAGAWEVTVARSTVEGNAGGGVAVGNGNGGTYRMAVTDNVLRRNGFDAVQLVANTGEAATGLVGGNRIVGNGVAGISCAASGTGTTTIAADRNEVLGNTFGLIQGGGCTFKSTGNNAVSDNTTDVAGGPLTPVAPM